MSNSQRIETLLKEAENAKAWLAKFQADLKVNPADENLQRLIQMTRHQIETRVLLLAKLGVQAEDRSRSA
jgi:hypothetical protein